MTRCLALLCAVWSAPVLLAQQPAAEPAPPPNGQVLFSRSAGQADAQSAPLKSATVAVTDAMRRAPVFLRYELNVHLQPATAHMEVQARLELRNASTAPLVAVPLQLSSSLHMERVLLAGNALPLAQSRIDSDADHTGALEETAVMLPQPLAPGASVVLTAEYSGTMERSTVRLDRLGTPPEVAERSDWDGIGEDFTGLRGFGDAVWCPVASVPALLGNGADLFTEIDRQRAVNQDATVSMRVTEEFTGEAPTVAVLAGHALPIAAPQTAPNAGFPGVVEVALPATRLGFAAPSLVVARRVAGGTDPAGLVAVWPMPEHAGEAQGYLTAATLVAPLLREWLPARQSAPLALVDLPIEGAQPSEIGDSLLISLRTADPPKLAPMLSGELPRVLFHSPRAWLQEGVPAFMSTLWAERTEGRQAALERIAASLPALELAEPAGGGGEDLLHASDAIRYRGKAVYVLAMLRDIAGDKALAEALKSYRPADDTRPEYFESLVEKASGRDLRWFFEAWVYRDLGLADLGIADVFPSKQGDRWLVTITVTNDGGPEVEVPVTIDSGDAKTTERWRIAGHGRVTRRVVVNTEPTVVEVNDGTVPEVTTSVHRRILKTAAAQ